MTAKSLDLTSFPLTFKIYKLLAWNPLNETVTKSEVFYFTVAVFYGIVCFVQEMIYFFLHVGNDNESSVLVLTNNLPCAGFVVLTMVKLSAVYFNRAKLTEIFKDLQELDDASLEKVNENPSFVRISKEMLKVFTVLFMILIWIFNLMPLVKMTTEVLNSEPFIRQLPYYLTYPFDVHQPIVYEICYVILTWGAFTDALGILTSDLLLCSFLTFICMQFVNLKYRLEAIINDKKMDEHMRTWIDDHNKLLSICENIERIFSFSILVNFTGGSIIICLAGFQTTVSVIDSNRNSEKFTFNYSKMQQGSEIFDLIKFLLYLLSSLVQIFIICWHGENLMETSSALASTISACRWYELTAKDEKDLQVVMIRSQKPTIMTAFKFSNVSLNSFRVVIGTSFSYLSCMRSIYSQTEEN